MAGKAVNPDGNMVLFDKGDIIANGRQLFGKAPEVVAGALYDVTTPITIEQAKAKVEEYLTRPINNKGGK
jgi:hypothetical protein